MSTITVTFLIFVCSFVAMAFGEMMCGKLSKGIKMTLNDKAGGQRVVGGNNARIGTHPWIVTMKKKNGRSHHCGGSLIRVSKQDQTDIVLTAAHCVFNKTSGKPLPMDEETVTAGTIIVYPEKDQKQGLQTVGVAKAIYHGLYPKTQVNDIAILVLKTPIKFTDIIQPVCLPQYGDQVEPGTELVIAGWGLTDEHGVRSSPILQQVAVPVVTQSYCEKQLTGNKIYECMMMCAGFEKGQKDACSGDSGGPFVENKKDTYVLQGVVSFGIGCARAGTPGVYTRVSTYMNWINKKIKENSQVYKDALKSGEKNALLTGIYESGNEKLKQCDKSDIGEFQPDMQERKEEGKSVKRV